MCSGKSSADWRPSCGRKRSEHLPVVLTWDEVRAVLHRLDGVMWLVVSMLYGAGLRLSECLGLRVKDLDFTTGQIVVRSGKGGKDRVAPLPAGLQTPPIRHLERVRRIHTRDLARGFGRVVLPEAIVRKYPTAAIEWGWQFVFPAARMCRDPRWGPPSRYHLHESVVLAARPARHAAWLTAYFSRLTSGRACSTARARSLSPLRGLVHQRPSFLFLRGYA